MNDLPKLSTDLVIQCF